MKQTHLEFVCFRHNSVPCVQSETHKHKKHKILQNSLSALNGIWLKAAIKGQEVNRIFKSTWHVLFDAWCRSFWALQSTPPIHRPATGDFSSFMKKKTDQLPSEETSSPTTPEAYRTGRGCSLCKVPSVTKVWIFFNSAVLVFENQQLSCSFFRPQRRKRRRGGCEAEPDRAVLIEGNTDEQKTAEEKLKERLKAKFGGGGHAREQGQPASKRAKISWP